jgi:hypothetical protein
MISLNRSIPLGHAEDTTSTVVAGAFLGDRWQYGLWTGGGSLLEK